MKTIILILLALAIATQSFADVLVNGYYKSNGTYVNPYVRSNPDAFKENNYGNSPYRYGR